MKKKIPTFKNEEFANPEDKSQAFTSGYTAWYFLMTECTPKLPAASCQGWMISMLLQNKS